MEGVVRAPSLFSKTTGSPPSITDMHELVVPRSIPKTLAIDKNPFWSSPQRTDAPRRKNDLPRYLAIHIPALAQSGLLDGEPLMKDRHLLLETLCLTYSPFLRQYRA